MICWFCLVLLCYKIWIKSSPDQSWQAFQTGYRLREAMSPKLDLAGIPERRDTVVLGIVLFFHLSPIRTAPSFRQLTFSRGFVSGARFTPDGKAIVYSAS